MVLPIKNSLQGIPQSGRNWMHMIDKVLIQKLGLTTTTHDQCINKRGSGDNASIATSGQYEYSHQI